MTILAIIIMCIGICLVFTTSFITNKIININYRYLSKEEKQQKFKKISKIIVWSIVFFTLFLIIIIKIIS
jgi:Na+/proline symporter